MVRIRLKRMGSKNRPFWRMVVTDSRMPRDGRFIEEVGFYNAKVNPPQVEMKLDRINYWISVGAQPSTIIKNLLKKRSKQTVVK